jgi:hypothetical protein
MTQQIKTIKLKNKEYAPVGNRINAFNSKHPNGSIVTVSNFTGNVVMFKATVTPNTDKKDRFFTAHSFGDVKQEKALEKLETVAVGRALAFAGFSTDGTIASQEEMEVFEEKQEQAKKIATPQIYQSMVDWARAGKLDKLTWEQKQDEYDLKPEEIKMVDDLINQSQKHDFSGYEASGNKLAPIYFS